MPTTWSIKPGGGGDFTSLQAAIDDAGVSNGDTLSCDESAICQSTTLTVSKAVTITASGAHALKGATYAAATSKARISVSSGSAVVIAAAGAVLENVGVLSSSGSLVVDAQETCAVRRCYVRNGGSGSNGILLTVNGKTLTVTNTVVQLIDTNCVGIGEFAGSSAVVHADQCSILQKSGGYAGFYVVDGSVRTRGCIVQGSGADNWRIDGSGNFNSSDYDVSQDTSAPGASSQHSTSGQFTDTGDTTADLSLVAANAFVNRTGFDSDTATDIVGTTRPSTGADPGAWQTPGGTVPSSSYHGSPVAAVEGISIGTVSPTLDSGDPATSFAITTGSLSGTGLSFNTTNGNFTGRPLRGTHGTLTIGVTPTNATGAGAETTIVFNIGAGAFSGITLRGYWKHDETGTGVRADSTGNGLTLTNNNSVTNGAGALNNASAFVTTSSRYLSRPTETLLETGDVKCGVSLWAKFTSLLNYEDLVSKFGGSTNEFVVEVDSTGQLTLYYGTGTVTWSSLLTTGVFYNIVAWHDPVANLLWITVNNGTPVSASYSGGNTVGNSTFMIGASNLSGASDFVDGLIDETALFDGNPTAGDLTTMYGGGTPPDYSVWIVAPSGAVAKQRGDLSGGMQNLSGGLQ